MNYKKQLLEDYKNCKTQIKFWKRIKNDINYEDLFSASEIDELIDYYSDMKKYISDEIKESKFNKNNISIERAIYNDII